MSAQLDLFTARLPHRPYCTDHLDYGVRVRDKQTALRARYIQANPPSIVGTLVFDVDRESAAYAWESAGLPAPSIVAVNPENGHAHLLYAIQTPVAKTDAARPKPLRFLAALQAAMTAQLGADPGYAMFITKNPLHPAWRVLTHAGAVYGLSDLAEYVDLTLAKKQPKVEASGLGRNCDLFDNLRKRAYRKIREFREGGSYDTWSLYILETARKLNRYTKPLLDSEVKATARSVAKWTWRHFGTGAAVERFSERQRARQKRMAAARRGRTAEAVLIAVAGLQRAGKRVTAAAVARLVGVHRSTVTRRHQSLVTAVLVPAPESVAFAKSDNSAPAAGLPLV